MDLTIVVDNYCAKSGLLAEWGYSSFLQTPDGNLLFDTGGTGHIFKHNLQELGISLKEIQALVLSHSHHDHVGGVMDILYGAPQAKLYAGFGVDRERRGDADGKRRSGGFSFLGLPNTFEIDNYLEVLPNVFAFRVPQQSRMPRFVCCRNMWEVTESGELVPDSFEDDVSIAVKGDAGWSILLGCAHAGLPNILQRAKELFAITDFNMVIGGSHLCAAKPEEYPDWFEKLSGFSVQKWRLNHCTGFKAAAAMSSFFKDVDWAGAGSVYKL